jgi:hypothetical protein
MSRIVGKGVLVNLAAVSGKDEELNSTPKRVNRPGKAARFTG